MRRASVLALGVRLAAGGGRAAIGRLLLMSAGVGVGVALLIGGLGIAPALQARHARDFARRPVFSATARPAGPGLQWSQSYDRIGDRDVSVYAVRAVGRAPLPPGLSRLPGTGEMVVSPALADLLDTPLGRIAAARFPSRTVGTVGPDGLGYPQEPVAYVGVGPAYFGPGQNLVTAFGSNSPAPYEPIPFLVKLLIVTGVAGLMIPTLVFVATSTRLSAASRERRLAAIRLVGATPSQARLLAAVESGLAAAVGSILGVAIFFAARPLVASLPLAGYRWFPSDIAPPLWQAAAVVLAAPALAVAAAVLGLRRLILSPLGVTRRAEARRPSARRAIPLVLGLALLGAAWAGRGMVERGGPRSLVVLGTAVALLLMGTAAVAPWLGLVAGSLAGRGERGLGGLLGIRRLQADPGASGRVVAAMALLVFAAGLAHSLVAAYLVQGGADAAPVLRPAAAIIDGLSDDGVMARRLRGVPGVRRVVSVTTAYTTGRGGAPAGVGVWIAECAGLRTVLLSALPGCGPSTAYLTPTGRSRLAAVPRGAAVPVSLEVAGPARRVMVRVPATVRTVPSQAGPWPAGVEVIVPPSAVLGDRPRILPVSRTFVATDGTAASVERIRNAVADLGRGAAVRTPEQLASDGDTATRQITSLLDLGVLLAMGIALANLLVVSIDHVQERRRPVAALAASGVPRSVLRRSVAVEIGLPVAAGVAASAVLTVVTSALLGAIVDAPMRPPLSDLAGLAALAAATVVAATALTFPALARAARPDTLRIE